jgi:hypothetical protein
VRTLEDVAQVENHWWWRPGWRTGRRIYACHITFENQPRVQDLAATYQEPLRPLQGLDLIPRSWLHLTMQGIGFTDEISDSEIRAITSGISDRLSSITPPTITLARPTVQTEAIYIPATPADAVNGVRGNVHAVIKEVLGMERTPDNDLDKALQTYRPHMSIAYTNRNGSAAPFIEALRKASHIPVTLTIRRVSVLTFHRDNRMYEWKNSVPVTVGRPVEPGTA